MRFLLFSDFHCVPGVFNAGDMDKLRYLQQRAVDEHCDIILHAGDLSHGAGTVPELVKAYNSFPILSLHTLGNHDADKTPHEEVLRLFGLSRGHYFLDIKGYRFIFCDTNYLRNKDGSYTHYSLENYVGREKDKDWLPPKQLAWLEQLVNGSTYPCIILSHQSFEREADGVKNQAEVRRIFNEANRRRPHSVLMCINGHNHRSNVRLLDGICYMEIPAACFDYVPLRHSLFPAQLEAKYSLIGNTVMPQEPLHAVIELEGTAIRCKGTQTGMFMDVTVEKTGNQVFDAAGRMMRPTVESFSVTL